MSTTRDALIEKQRELVSKCQEDTLSKMGDCTADEARTHAMTLAVFIDKLNSLENGA